MSTTLSYKKGKRLAKVIGGSQNGSTIYLYDPQFKCCLNCKNNCEKKPCCDKCSKKTYHTSYNRDNLKEILQQLKKGNLDSIELDEEVGSGQPVKSVVLRGGIMQQVPSNMPFTSPDLKYVSGSRGCGKTFHIVEYLQQFKIYYPKYKIYLFSQKKEDALLDPYIHKRIDTNQVKDAMFEALDFKESMVIFDDVDTLPSTKANNVKEAVYKLMDDVIEVGRSLGVFCIVTSHLACNNTESKRILNGCTSYTFFLASSSHQITYSLNKYFGFSPKQVKAILALPNTRYVTVFREVPTVVMTNDRIFLLSELEQ
jgi:hypothetical protein